MKYRWTVFVALLLALVVVSPASAHAPWKHQRSLATPKLHYLFFLKAQVNDARDDRCRTQPKLRVVREIAPWNRQYYIVKWRDTTLPNVRSRSSICLPTYPPDIIRYYFPSWAEETAVRIAYCESVRPVGGNWYVATRTANFSNGLARGLFQEMPSWYNSSNNAFGHPFDPYNPYLNTIQAVWLMKHGGFMTHWSASAGCWG